VPNVISIGNTCLDIILSETTQLPKWNSELIFPKTEWRLGGQGANFAIAASHLELKSVLATSIGTDEAGNRILGELAATTRIDEHLIKREKSETGFSVTLVRRDGERSFLTFLGHQKLFTTKPIMNEILNIIETDSIVHISGLYMLPKLRRELLSLFKRLHDENTRISFDPGWNPEGFSKAKREEFYRLLSYVAFYEPNDAELKQLTGQTTVQAALRRVEPKFGGVLALKLGKKGSKIIEPSGKVTFEPPFLTRVADTTGAGDAFDAGFIAGILRNRSVQISAKIGNATASIAISRRGRATLRFPRLREVQTAIERQQTPSSLRIDQLYHSSHR
jgi:argininosuccinate lyase